MIALKIYEKEPEITLSGKSGSIDVLDRSNTFISYKPVLKNYSGRIDAVNVVGSSQFDAYYDEMTGRAVVFARDNARFAKDTYQVKLRFHVHNGYMDKYITAKPVQIRVMQGKPTVKMEVEGGNWTTYDRVGLYETLKEDYVVFGAPARISLQATLKNQAVEIESVELLNFREDFWLIEEKQEDGTVNHHRIELWRTGYVQAVKKGTYTLKFRVRFRDRIGTSKDTIVKCKVVIK